MKKFTFILCLLWMYTSTAQAQKDSAIYRLGAFVKNIQTFNRLYPQEKVYLHFDNTGYFLGETLWFKAYVTTATELSGTPMSRVLYVELLNEEGHIMESRKLCIENGQAHGEIALTKANLRSGYYEIRAYTRIMLNWDRSALFSRVFPVFETPKKDGEYAHKTIRKRSLTEEIKNFREHGEKSKELNMDFFPEGGTLVKGISGRIAFKLTNKAGNPVEAEGILYNKEGDTVTTISTRHEGMGSFVYISSKKPQYVVVNYNGSTHRFALPEADNEGYVMQVDNTTHPDEVHMRLQRNEKSATPGLTGLTISCRGKISAFKVIDLQPEETHYVLRIPRSELQTGVNQLTLYTPEGRVLAERMIFVNQGEHLTIEARKDQEHYQPFAPVQIEFDAKDENGQPVHTTFSLAVRDAETQIPTTYRDNILTNLLLGSDLKGFIKNPGYYFESNNKDHVQNLDLLMLTQGYRRYEWTQMAGINPFTVYHHIEKGIVINGKVLSLIRKKGNANMEVNMSMFSNNGLFQKATCMTDSAGNFNYLAEDFYGKWNLQIESKRKDKRKEKWITLDRLFTPRGRAYTFYDTYIPPFEGDYALRNTFNEIQESTRMSKEDIEQVQKKAKLLREIDGSQNKNWEKIAIEAASMVYDMQEEMDKLEDAADGYNEAFHYFLYRNDRYYNLRGKNPANPNYTHNTTYTGENNGNIPLRPHHYLYDYLKDDERVTYKGHPVQFIYEGTRSGELPVDFFNTKVKVFDYGRAGRKDIYADREHILHTGSAAPTAIGPLRTSEIKTIAIIEQPEKFYSYIPNWNWHGSSGRPVIVYVKIDRNNPKTREPVGVRLTSLQGFSKPRSFYNPSYKGRSLPNEEDYRRTLYWNPNVTTDNQGKASVSFYNNGTCQKMEISAETITSDGTPGLYLEK